MLTDLLKWGGKRPGQGGAVDVSRTDAPAVASKAFPKFLSALSQQSSPVLIDFGPVIGANVEFFGDRLGCKLFIEDLFAVIDRHARAGTPAELAQGFETRFRHADGAEKRQFVSTALALYTGARVEQGLTADIVAHLTTNTPNRGLEQLLRAAHFSGKPLTAPEVVEQKRRGVVALSEQSLSVIEADRIKDVRLVGRNSAVPSAILERLAERLRRGDTRMPANVLLVGAPGTGKTDLAVLTAHAAGVTAYRVHSPKRGIVGETERLCDLQHDLLRHWTPNVAFVDEITESLPLERSEFDGDSGASRAVTAVRPSPDGYSRSTSSISAFRSVGWSLAAGSRA